ncbi:S41 family peptidase [Lignipirellula cremea]|uniref:Putative CtpA-like serine protease n=1 Tax=Lignipirellula cremea TaxID=2528010 RepID=A0A518DTV3_9BACT|nr:S41 family peptidase [Lignipirellula cremea]QDU95270.1 putative CtpA-like serine protease [Lignipirellula cremea]
MARREMIWLALVVWANSMLVLPFSQGALAAPPVAAKEVEDSPPEPEKSPQEEDAEVYELMRLFADTLDQVDRNYVKDISRRELMEAAIEGMLTKLDQYSAYIPPEQIDRFKSGVESEFGGIGIRVSVEGGILKVISPILGSPAYKAGVLAGDTIVEIEGESTRGITIDEAIAKLKGKVDTSVKVSVLHEGEEKPIPVELTRKTVRVATVLGDTRNDDDSWNYMFDEDQKIGYVRINTFGRHTTEELKETLDLLNAAGIKALVLDLRFNPGGLLSCAIEVSDLFVEEGKIVSTAGRNAPARRWDAHTRGTYADFPMVILVNRYSASASEIVSACLQDHERAVVIGERTWGKGSVQNIITLEDGRSALKLTTASYQRPSGKNIHRFEGATDEDAWGVIPNEGFLIKLSTEELREYNEFRRQRDIVGRKPEEGEAFEDRQLLAALSYLRGRLSGENEKEDDQKADGKTKKAPEKQAAAGN